MEFLTILLSGLLGLVSPLGLALDAVTAGLIRDQLAGVEELRVRIDNAPSYQVLQGRVERVRIAGRGVFPVEGIRIAVLEVETDAIAANPTQLRAGRLRLERPLQAGVRLVLKQADLNRALQAPLVTRQLNTFSFALSDAQPQQRYRLVNPQVELLNNNRLRLRVNLQSTTQPNDPGLRMVLETGLKLVAGRQVQLDQPMVSANDQPVPLPLIQQLVEGFNRQLDLQNFEASGFVARLLELEIGDGEINLAAFIQVKPEALAVVPDLSPVAVENQAF